MTDLERHIIKLLLDNDCVIVPGFGGFMAHNIAASYDEKNNVFCPPYRTIGFNPRLTMNDSLLAQAYTVCYDISYPEALKRIEHEVDVLKTEIEAEGTHTLCGIGKITLLKDGRYDFTPEASGITTPNLYGFGNFEIQRLSQSDLNDTEAPKEESNCVETLSTKIFNNNENLEVRTTASDDKDEKPQTVSVKDNNEIAVRIPLSIVRHIAAACVMLFILLTFPARLGDSSATNMKKSSINTSLLYEIMPKDITSGKPNSLNVIAVKKMANTENMTDEAQLSVKKSESNVCYSIVLASRISRKNAYAYAEKLKSEGMKDVIVESSNGITKVTYKHFNTREEANKAIKTLTENGRFKDCWITELK